MSKNHQFILCLVVFFFLAVGIGQAQTPTATCLSYQNSIVFDNAGSYTTNTTSVTSVSTSFFSTNSSVSDSILVLQVQIGDNTNSVSTATYNGMALTRAVKNKSFTVGDDMEIWYLTNPQPGTNTLVVNFSGSCTSHIGMVTYDGVNPITPVGRQFLVLSRFSAQPIGPMRYDGELFTYFGFL